MAHPRGESGSAASPSQMGRFETQWLGAQELRCSCRKPVVARFQGKVSRIYFRADAAFAMPEVYEFLEAERIKYAIRLPANQVLQSRIGYLLTRPVGRPPHHVRRFHANFSYQAGTWTKPRSVIAKVEWHPGEPCPSCRSTFISPPRRPRNTKRCPLCALRLSVSCTTAQRQASSRRSLC